MLRRMSRALACLATVSLDASELKFAAGGILTVTVSREQPADADARANWLPASEG